MRGFLAVLRADFRSKVPLVVWLSVSLSVAVSGPFGSYEALTLLERFLFWPPVIGVAVLGTSAIRAFVCGPLALEGTFFGAILTSSINCLVLAMPLYFAISSLSAPYFSGSSAIFEIVILVFALSMGVCSLRLSVSDATEAKAPAAPAPKEVPRLLRRLSQEFEGELWAISVRDHYVDVQTSVGKFSLLMRFSDAIAEAEPTLGTQVHRSHWVAWAAVGSVVRDGGKMVLQLHDGHLLPVSRNHREKVDLRFPAAADVSNAAA